MNNKKTAFFYFISLLFSVLSCLCFIINASEIPSQYRNEDKIYLNVLKVKLKESAVSNGTDLNHRLKSEGLEYLMHISPTLLLFRKEEIAEYSASPCNADLLIQLQNRLSDIIVFIEQDYERRMFMKINRERLKYKPPDDKKINFLSSGEVEQRRMIRVAVPDARFQLDHRYLRDAIDRELCYDFIDKDTDPGVRLDDPKLDFYLRRMSHGTKCLGRIGAKSDLEGGCDPGVCPNCKLVGLRTMRDDGHLSDGREAETLLYKLDDIDIFSCSYGIKENHGFFGPGNATKEALRIGAEKGRECLGRIYVYPSGNGDQDNCNADGYASSVHTITIASIERNKSLPPYTEICACALAATIGQGYNTTDLDIHTACTNSFDGTSASVAVAAGYIGETLTVNPLLTARDVAHIIVATARSDGLDPSISWRLNGIGHLFNDQIGFGRMDITKMKEKARNWNSVPEAHICNIPGYSDLSHGSGTNFILPISISSDSCKRTRQVVRYLEYVQVELQLKCSMISEVAINVISPMNTSSPLLTKIKMNKTISDKFTDLTRMFMSAHIWGEDPYGTWTVQLEVIDATEAVDCQFGVKTLVLHGTKEDPLQPHGGHFPVKCVPEGDENNRDIRIPWQVVIGTVSAILLVAAAVAAIVYRKCRYHFFCRRSDYYAGENTSSTVSLSGSDSVDVEINNYF